MLTLYMDLSALVRNLLLMYGKATPLTPLLKRLKSKAFLLLISLLKGPPQFDDLASNCPRHEQFGEYVDRRRTRIGEVLYMLGER